MKVTFRKPVELSLPIRTTESLCPCCDKTIHQIYLSNVLVGIIHVTKLDWASYDRMYTISCLSVMDGHPPEWLKCYPQCYELSTAIEGIVTRLEQHGIIRIVMGQPMWEEREYLKK